MNRTFQSLTAAGVVSAFGALTTTASAGHLDAGLADYLAGAPAHEVVSTLVYLTDRIDPIAMDAGLTEIRATRHRRHQIVVTELQKIAAWSQPALLDAVETMKADGSVAHYQAFWVANCVRVDGTPAAIAELAERDDVDWIFYNYPIEPIEPVPSDGPKKITEGPIMGGPEPGVIAVRAPEVWNDLGLDGTGILVSTLDTGVDGNHPALASRWKGNDPAYANNPEWAWFDPVTNTDFPFDSGSHGTHTMGSVLGGAPGNQIGVAPGAEWIHAAVIDRVGLSETISDAILAFQWVIDPDGNPNTSFDVPHTCSNSWGIGTFHNVPPYNAPCDDSFWSFLDACEAAGVVVLFAAGNEGSSPNTLRRPSDRATDEYRNCAVAALNANNPPSYPIAGFSSRGPTNCGPNGESRIKPDIAAPGDDVISSVPGNNYSSFSGTSMATPHVNGVVALMRQACPDLSADEIKQVIYDTALDLGPAGKDNDFGYGLIDAYEAVNIALALCGPGPPRARDAYYEVAANGSMMIELEAVDYDGAPGGPLQYVITALPMHATLTDAGNNHDIVPGDLPYTLVNDGAMVQLTPDVDYYGDDEFRFASDDGGSPPDGGLGEDGFISLLVLFDAPTIATTSLPNGYLDLPYAATQLMANDGQPNLVWSTIGAVQYLEIDLGISEFQEVGVAQGWSADDGSWSYALPFAFEFFGELRTSVNVCSNGFLDFTSTSTDWSNSDSELIGAVRIAPLWDDLRTDQGGGTDIYIDESTPGQVTIRWQTVTYANGNPCNHAVTLFADGAIRFHYGSGNSPITPTVGISSGDGTNYLLTSYNGAGGLGAANSLRIFAPPLLPDGMSLSEAGVLSGTPTEFGLFQPLFVVTDALGRSDQVQLDLEILEEGCTGDVDGSGAVDFSDVVALLADWGACPGCATDLDANGSVEFNDLVLMLAAWGPCGG